MKCKFEHDDDCCNSGSPQYMRKCKPDVCGSAVPMTNADCIRGMSDEELAVFLWNFQLEDVATGKVEDFGPHLFRKFLKEWLQQPAEEGD